MKESRARSGTPCLHFVHTVMPYERLYFLSAQYWLHSVLGDSTCKHLRWYLLWMLLPMLDSIAQRCCTLISFLWMSCFCVLSQVVLANFRWFQLLLGGSSSFQVVPVVLGGSSSFLVLVYTPYLIIYQLKKFQCHIFFPSQDIKQNLLLSSLCHKL